MWASVKQQYMLSQGACGYIYETSEPDVVIKRMRRVRSKSHGAREQCRIQSKISQILCKGNGFNLLFAPKAWGATDKEYSMQRIECSRPVNILNNDIDGLNQELAIFYMKAMAYVIFPCDYELYLQDDGRVALVDFDKFGAWNSDGSVDMPWGETWTDDFVSAVVDHVLGNIL